MARSINRLSARTIETIAKPGRHADGGNLFLIVDAARENGSPRKPARRWAFIFRWDGKLKEMGLGSLNAISLARARELAGQYRTVLAENRNPIEVRRAEERKRVAGRTFGEVATELHSSLQSGWRGVKYRRQWLPTLRTYAAGIWERPVAEVETAHVLAILEPIWTTKAETAGKVRERIEAVLDAARARGLIPEDRANPARWRGHLVHLLAKRPKLQRGHHAALPFAEVSAFMSELREREAMAALCLQFVVLTCARSGEAMGARWSEMDLEVKLWTIPGSRMKAGKPHRVPLSDPCIDILRHLAPLRTGPDCYVFPGIKPGRPLSSMALAMLLRRMRRPVTPHGFRSSFRDWAGDCTTFPREVIEAALAHRVGDSVEAAYRRGDALEKRRQLMHAWADFCSSVRAGNVVALRQPSA